MIRPAGAALVLTVVLLAGCSSSQPAPPRLGDALAAKVTVDAMFDHLRALQDIANANKGIGPRAREALTPVLTTS